MNDTVKALLAGVFGLAMVAVIFAKPAAISDFFGGLGYVTGAAVSPVTGRTPSYPNIG